MHVLTLLLLLNQDAGKQKAAHLLDEGVARFEKGDYAGALEKFQSAHDAYASPKIFLNLGEALRKLGRDAEAAEAYSRFLAETPAKDISDAKRKIAQAGLDELTPRLGRLTISAAQPGVQVTLDGKSVALRDRPYWVTPGTHSIAAQAPGLTARTLWAEVHAGEDKRVPITLELPSAPAPTPVAPAPTPVAPAAPVEPQPAAHAADQPTTARSHLGAWIAGGTGAALLVGGVVFGLEAGSAYDEYKTTTSLQRYNDLRDEVSTKSTVANILYVGAGAAAVTAGVLWWLEGRAPADTVAVTPMPSGAGLVVSGSFK